MRVQTHVLALLRDVSGLSVLELAAANDPADARYLRGEFLAVGVEFDEVLAADDKEVAIAQPLAAEGLVGRLLPDFLALTVAERNLIAAHVDDENIAVGTHGGVPR